MKKATISLWADRNFTQATKALVTPFTSHMSGSVALMPSSMDGKDPFVGLVQSALPEITSSFVTLPVSGPAARRAFFTPSVLSHWIDRPVRAPDASVGSITIPQDIAQADHRIIVTDVVEVARRGPFVLDLPARYLHPRQRMRLIASGEREALAAEVASAFPLDLFAVYLAQREGVILAVTSDIVSAELVALAMSELCTGSPRSFAGPWEDPVVQRATELEMGVLLPDRISLVSDGPDRSEYWAQRIVDHIRLRIGISNGR